MTMKFDDEVIALAKMIANLDTEDDVDDDPDAVFDKLFAEHKEMMRAADSYDEDAISYGEMV